MAKNLENELIGSAQSHPNSREEDFLSLALRGFQWVRVVDHSEMASRLAEESYPNFVACAILIKGSARGPE